MDERCFLSRTRRDGLFVEVVENQVCLLFLGLKAEGLVGVPYGERGFAPVSRAAAKQQSKRVDLQPPESFYISSPSTPYIIAFSFTSGPLLISRRSPIHGTNLNESGSGISTAGSGLLSLLGSSWRGCPIAASAFSSLFQLGNPSIGYVSITHLYTSSHHSQSS